MIWTSFKKLWPTVKPGGLYFIEDMQFAKNRYFRRSSPSCDGKKTTVSENLKGIVEDLIYDLERKGDVKFIYCQSEACVLGKK